MFCKTTRNDQFLFKNTVFIYIHKIVIVVLVGVTKYKWGCLVILVKNWLNSIGSESTRKTLRTPQFLIGLRFSIIFFHPFLNTIFTICESITSYDGTFKKGLTNATMKIVRYARFPAVKVPFHHNVFHFWKRHLFSHKLLSKFQCGIIFINDGDWRYK